MWYTLFIMPNKTTKQHPAQKQPAAIKYLKNPFIISIIVVLATLIGWWGCNAYLDQQEYTKLVEVKKDLAVLRDQIRTATGKEWELRSGCSAQKDKYSIIGYTCGMYITYNEPVGSVEEMKAYVDTYMNVIKSSSAFIYTPHTSHSTGYYPNENKGLTITSEYGDGTVGTGGGSSPHQTIRGCGTAFLIKLGNNSKPQLESTFHCGTKARADHGL